MFKLRNQYSPDDFEREVLMEVSYCRQMFGDGAVAEAMARAERKPLGSDRRRILQEAARRLEASAPPPG